MSPRVTPENRIPDIIKAAVRVFSRKGFRLTQMEEIAKEAEVSKATLYYYFKSKAHLFQYVLENSRREEDAPLPPPEASFAGSERNLLELLKKRLKEGSRLGTISKFLRKEAEGIDVMGELGEILEELWEIFEENSVQIVILEKSAAEFPELAKVYDKNARRQILSQLEQYLAARMRQGMIRRLNSVPATARFIMESLAWFGFKQSGSSGPIYPKSEALPDLISTFVNGLKK